MKTMPPTAIIGATGFLGRNFLPAYRKVRQDTIGTTRGSQEGLVHLDLLSPDIQPLKLAGCRDALIFSSMCGMRACEQDQVLSHRVNVEGTLELVRQLAAAGIRPVFFSSEIVFDGMSGGYDELAWRRPCNAYGRQKVEAEDGIQQICAGGNYLIVRLSKVFSLVKGDGTFLDEMASILRRGGVVRAAADQKISPTLVSDLVEIVAALQSIGAVGVIHVSAPEVWSRYELAMALAEKMKVDTSRVEKISLDDLREPYKRPRDPSMNTDKLKNLVNSRFTPIRQCIAEVAANWEERAEGPC